MILCGNIESSRINPKEKVGVVLVVFISKEDLEQFQLYS